LTTPPTSSASDASEDRSSATSTVQEETRQWILQRLREVMEITMQRVTSGKTHASDRIKWSRIAIGAGQACNAVLRDAEIDVLKQQINELKQLTLEKLSDEEDDGAEDGADQTRSEEAGEED
jgi:hypothetical protein